MFAPHEVQPAESLASPFTSDDLVSHGYLQTVLPPPEGQWQSFLDSLTAKLSSSGLGCVPDRGTPHDGKTHNNLLITLRNMEYGRPLVEDCLREYQIAIQLPIPPWRWLDLALQWTLANDVFSAQVRNLLVGVADLGQNLVGVRAETRGLAGRKRGRLREFDRCADASVTTVVDHHPAMHGVRLCECLWNRVDRSRGNTGAHELPAERLHVVRCKRRLELGAALHR